jgi:hypothetical protein
VSGQGVVIPLVVVPVEHGSSFVAGGEIYTLTSYALLGGRLAWLDGFRVANGLRLTTSRVPAEVSSFPLEVLTLEVLS